MKVLPICAYTVVIDSCSVPTHDSMAKADNTNDDHGQASTDRLDLQQLNSNSDDSMTASDHVDSSIDASSIDNDTIFHTSYTEARQFHKMFLYEEALEKYRVALQCKHRTIQSEPRTIQEKFCSILYYIGKLHFEAGMDDTMRGIEAMYFCLNVRRSCFGSTHPSVASVLLELASIHEEYSEHQYALDLLLEALAILLPDTSVPDSATSSNRALIHVWNSIGRAHRALGQDEEAQSSFEEAEKLKL
jgi:tetratricopeptide (TPR) repeat protein